MPLVMRVGKRGGANPFSTKSSSLNNFEINQVNPYSYFAVFDGHGPAGSQCAEFLSKHLVRDLSGAIEHKFQGQLCQEAFTTPFYTVNTALDKSHDFDTDHSGSTACVVVLDTANRSLVCANVGTSRCLIGSIDPATGATKVVQLSRDHLPDDLDEMKRLILKGARVDRITEHDDGPKRVYSRDPRVKGPGLPMSRSFGDHLAHDLGVSVEPELTRYTISPNDRWIVLATEGVTKQLGNLEVINIIREQTEGNADPKSVLDKVLLTSQLKWLDKHNSCEDQTLIVIHLQPSPSLLAWNKRRPGRRSEVSTRSLCSQMSSASLNSEHFSSESEEDASPVPARSKSRSKSRKFGLPTIVARAGSKGGVGLPSSPVGRPSDSVMDSPRRSQADLAYKQAYQHRDSQREMEVAPGTSASSAFFLDKVQPHQIQQPSSRFAPVATARVLPEAIDFYKSKSFGS